MSSRFGLRQEKSQDASVAPTSSGAADRIGEHQLSARHRGSSARPLGDICIASRTLAKCDGIADSVRAMGHLRDPQGRLHTRQLDALDVGATVAAIKETELDHQMGKLSDEDYGRMRERFERQALDALAALERGGGRRG